MQSRIKVRRHLHQRLPACETRLLVDRNGDPAFAGRWTDAVEIHVDASHPDSGRKAKAVLSQEGFLKHGGALAAVVGVEGPAARHPGPLRSACVIKDARTDRQSVADRRI